MIPGAEPCPCGTSLSYAACCRRFVVDGELAPTAEALMRSRYTAYAMGSGDHLFRTWHPRTRPADIEPDQAVINEGLAGEGRDSAASTPPSSVEPSDVKNTGMAAGESSDKTSADAATG